MSKASLCRSIAVYQARRESLQHPEFGDHVITDLLRAEILKAVRRRFMALYQARLEQLKHVER
jgi:hypothetical protein